MKSIKERLGKSIYKAVMLVVCLVFTAVMFTGCNVKGADVDTELVINRGFDGVRTITVQIPSQTFDKYVSAGWNDFSGLIINSCPAQMACEAEQGTGNYIFTFSVVFDSLDDYRAKISAILGREAGIFVELPSSVFERGIGFQEDFSSVDLLSWIPATLNNAGYISIENADKLLVSGKNTAVYDGAKYENAGEHIAISDKSALAINSITINTYVNSNRTFNREITIELPDATMDANGDAIKEYFDENLPEGVEGDWRASAKKHTYTASIKDKSIEMVKNFTAHVLDNANCEASYEDSSDNGDLLNILMCFNEKLDFGAFSSEGSGQVPVVYNFDVAELYQVTVQAKVDGNDREPVVLDNISGSTTLIEDNAKELEMQISMNRQYLVENITAETTVNGDDNIRRSIIFALSETPTEFEQKIISTKLNNSTYMNLSAEMVSGRYCLINISEGTELGVSAGFKETFKQDGSIIYDVQNDSIGDSDSFTYSEAMDFAGFMPYTDDVTLVYKLKVDGSTLDKDSLLLSAPIIRGLEISGGNADVKIYGTNLSLKLDGARSSSMVFWIVIIFVLVTVIAGAVFAIIKLKGDGISVKSLKRGGSKYSFAEKTQIDAMRKRDND